SFGAAASGLGGAHRPKQDAGGGLSILIRPVVRLRLTAGARPGEAGGDAFASMRSRVRPRRCTLAMTEFLDRDGSTRAISVAEFPASHIFFIVSISWSCHAFRIVLMRRPFEGWWERFRRRRPAPRRSACGRSG